MLTGRASAATISVMGWAAAAAAVRPDRPGGASSTRVFHAPQDGQRPAHFGWVVPHSVHRFLLMSRQPTQGVSRSTVTPRRKGRPLDLTAEERRLRDARANPAWRLWGPYLSERQWGTVREDYSEGGDAWDYFTHDAARSRAYRWGEDGLAGQCDDHQRMCFAIALWNEQDAILKERLFGLTNSEGNHGEDVKEYYFYLDNVPTHSYQRWLYKYPQRAYPYGDLVRTNRSRSRREPEYELLDTGIFDDGRYFDVQVEYAKAGPWDLAFRITAANRGPDDAPLHLLPTLWFRNTWSWPPNTERPRLSRVEADHPTVLAEHEELGQYTLHVEGPADLLFCENESNCERLFGSQGSTPYPKDGINDRVVSRRRGHGQP